MTPEENDLRRALDARSGAPSPEFRTRLRDAFAQGKPGTNFMPAIALATVFVLTVTSVGVLLAARNFGRIHGGLASGARVVTPTPIAMPTSAQLVAPSSNVVWVLVDYVGLYRSTDQGAHWEARPMPTEVGVRPSISFIDDHEGWLLAPGSPTTQCQQAQAAVWHTTDAGATWQNLSVGGIAESQCKEHIWFVDSKHGFISAWDDNHRPTIYFTQDGGYIWRASTLPDPPDFKTLPGGFTLRADWVKRLGSTLFLEAWGLQGAGTPYPDIPDRQYILVSTDGGVTWMWKQKVASRSIVMVSEMRWLQLAMPGQSYESTNGGQQFHQYDSDFNTDTPAGAHFVFADAQIGYAEGRGSLQRTVDGGAHWVRIATPGTQQLSSPPPTPGKGGAISMPTDVMLSAPSANVVWALVAGQYLFRSRDQGRTWEQRNWAPYRGGGGPQVISFADETFGWALFPGVPATQCSQAGAQLWRTSDGAATWQLIASVDHTTIALNGLPFDQCKEYVAFVDRTQGFVAAHDTARQPAVYRTSDGGLTWAPGSIPDPPGFVTSGGGNALRVVSIRAFGTTVLLSAASGNDLYIFSSIDGGKGKTWTYAATVSNQSRLELSFLTPTHWLIIQAGLETTDAGKTWHTFGTDYTDVSGVPSTFVFADEKIGYGTVRGGLQRSVDGGAHWERIKNSWP